LFFSGAFSSFPGLPLAGVLDFAADAEEAPASSASAFRPNGPKTAVFCGKVKEISCFLRIVSKDQPASAWLSRLPYNPQKQ